MASWRVSLAMRRHGNWDAFRSSPIRLDAAHSFSASRKRFCQLLPGISSLRPLMVTASVMLAARLMNSNMKLNTTSDLERLSIGRNCSRGMRQPFGSIRKKANGSCCGLR